MVFSSKTTFLPAPLGTYNVGYVDYMNEGLPQESTCCRIYYPTQQPTELLADRCPDWTTPEVKDGLITFMHSMVQHWPSWVPDKEFAILGAVKAADKMAPELFPTLFKSGWSFLADAPKIPIVHQAQLHPSSGKLPVVVFTHGMGCNRSIYSKICYDLASEGVVVVAVEHREGSASMSQYYSKGTFTQIFHRRLKKGEEEYEVRNKQMQQRALEVRLAVDLIQRINDGSSDSNVFPQEAGFELTQFEGRLNMDSLFCMGHSFGGSTCLFAASLDPRFAGAIALDPWMFPVAEEAFKLTKPCLVVNTEMFLHPMSEAKLAEVTSPEVTEFRVLEGAVHLVHTDAPLLFRNDLLKGSIGMLCTRPGTEVLAENHDLVWSWLSQQKVDLWKGVETCSARHKSWQIAKRTRRGS